MNLEDGIKHIRDIAEKKLGDYEWYMAQSSFFSPLKMKEVMCIQSAYDFKNRSLFIEECITTFHLDSSIPIQFSGSKTDFLDGNRIEVFVFDLEVEYLRKK